jgi:hypothetical protein
VHHTAQSMRHPLSSAASLPGLTRQSILFK